MLFKSENIYHPFTNSSFGIFLNSLVDEDSVVGGMIEDINLYYQPVKNPLTAFVFLAIKSFLLVIAEYLQVKVYKLMKKENGIIKNITQLLVCTQMVFWPFWIFFATSIDFIHPMNKVLGAWFCYGGAFLFRFLGYIISFHSFLSALMRYIFLLHEDVANTHGKKRVKDIFFLLSILLPFFMAVWEMVDGPDLDGMSFINKCHGKHHRVFLIDTSTLNVAKRNFCAFKDYNDYNSSGAWSRILGVLRQISCIVNQVAQIFMGLNIAEGILYFRILSHINR